MSWKSSLLSPDSGLQISPFWKSLMYFPPSAVKSNQWNRNRVREREDPLKG